MKIISYIFTSMVQAITVLTVLKMMAKAQTTCNQGMGRVMYERLPNQQLQGFDDDVVRDSAPPFQVLEKCQDLCLRDRTAANNIVRACSSFDFQPGSRIASFSGTPEYEESTCYLTREQAAPEGIGQLMLVPNSVHFTEVCITSNRPERECPMRRYIFERHPRKKLKLPAPDIKEMTATNRSECEDRCLNEFSFVCRSASYDAAMRICSLSRFTRRTHPELLEDDPNSDYLENTCLNAERRCDGLAVFIKEENKRLGGPFEVDLFTNMTLEECQAMCIRAEKYFCRSIEFDDMTKQCVISEEDSVSQKDDLGISSSPTNNFYDLVCLDNPSGFEYPDNSLRLYITARGSEYPDNSVTSHLFGSNGRRPDTAFQRYRNSRLSGEFHSEITGRSLSECLDECLRQTSFQCRSAVYSDRYRTCRLSRFNQRDGMRIIYDADYDYYENLMHHLVMGIDGEGNTASGRPDPVSPDNTRPTYPAGGGGGVGGGRDPYDDRGRPPIGPDRFPDRYPSRYPNWYPAGNGGDPYDRYPPGTKYPVGPRYPPGDRYPSDGDRYPIGSGRYPPGGRYPPTAGGSYPPSGGGDRYPPSGGGGGRYPPMSSGRYPLYENRYPAPNYPPSGGVSGRYPPGDRYPPAPVDRYPPAPIDRYPPAPVDRYPPASVDRYPPAPVDRYPTSPADRYPSRGPPDYPPKYPVGGRPPYDDRLPPNDIGRYPATGSRYPIAGGRPPYDYDRYPVDRYPGDRYGPDEDRYNRGRYPVNDRFGGDRYPPSGGNRWGYGRPVYDGPEYPGVRPGYDEGPGGYGPQRPFGSGTRCDEGGDNFKQIGAHQRVRRQFIRRFTTVPSLMLCQRECAEARDFVCRSFNYRDPVTPSYDGERDNCELSDRDTRDLDINNPAFFDSAGNYDFYERSAARNGVDGDCLDVSQECNEDGMTFTLRTPEGFVGRIYTYGFYDRCFFRGNGGTVNVLRISGAQGYPECGTQRYGDTMTNIVVVQFSDYVQTGKDKRFNLTCLFRGPGEAVVTSGYIGAGWDLDSPMSRSGSPIPIEYLPAENSLSSKVRLLILYQGRPTTTIAVGDPLTFRLEAQDGYNYLTDIFATNVIARDPYSGRSVQLIDRYGCPVDTYVFPELDRLRDGDTLEARFNAFKIPESNFLVFEATVRTCRDGCQPAYCTSNTGRSEPSFGKRRRRSINDTDSDLDNMLDGNSTVIVNATAVNFIAQLNDTDEDSFDTNIESDQPEFPEHVREMIEVFDSREELQMEARKIIALPETVCLSNGEYHAFISAIFILIILLLGLTIAAGWVYRRYWSVISKNLTVDRLSPSINSSHVYPQSNSQSQRSNILSYFGGGSQKPFSNRGLPRVCDFGQSDQTATPGVGAFEDPSEPIYTDPSLFERSRSLCSISVAQDRHRARSNERI